MKNAFEVTRKTEADRWVMTYDDLDAIVADGDDDDELWLLARAMCDDALASGCGELDVGEVMEALSDLSRAASLDNCRHAAQSNSD